MTADKYLNTKPEQLREMERAAYASGDTDRAALLEALIFERERAESLQDEMDDLPSADQRAADAEELEALRQFFRDCFENLAGDYPAPSVTSDYDCSVIFEAIRRGEDTTDI